MLIISAFELSRPSDFQITCLQRFYRALPTGCRLTFTMSEISFHCSGLGSTPVGLWAHACSMITLCSGIFCDIIKQFWSITTPRIVETFFFQSQLPTCCLFKRVRCSHLKPLNNKVSFSNAINVPSFYVFVFSLFVGWLSCHCFFFFFVSCPFLFSMSLVS